ncbi:MAG: murein biosynthesis integral membrane protein MurJ [Actinomycetota bacterium]|nr:murein biosynthesis integral membrane protein MurJ [Actinomycetota bacterium]
MTTSDAPPRSGLLRNASAMALGTLISRVTGLLRLVVLAWALGISSLSDVFNLSNNAPNTFYDLLIGGVLASTLIPVMVKASSRVDRREASEALSAILTTGVAALLAATLVFELIAGLVIRGYMLGNHDPTRAIQLSAATNLLRLFAPQLFFYGAISLFTSLLNTRGRFALPAFAPITNNIVAIIVLVVFRLLYGHLGTNGAISAMTHLSPSLLLLGLGTTFGVAIQCAVVLMGARRVGLTIGFNFDIFHPAVREIAKLSGWTFGYVLGNQVSLYVLLALADAHSPGSVSAYNNAYLFFQLPYGIAAYSVMAAIIPGLADDYAHEELAVFRRRFGRGLRASVALLIPSAIAYLTLGSQLVGALLGHGAATTHGVNLTVGALAGLAIGLPGFGIYLAMIQGLQAARLAKEVFWVYAVENGLTVILAVALVSGYGVTGLALAVSVSYTVAAVLAYWVMRGKRLAPRLGPVLASWLKFLLPSLAMAAAILLVSHHFAATGGARLFAKLVAELIAGGVAFGLFLWLEYAVSALAGRRRMI